KKNSRIQIVFESPRLYWRPSGGVKHQDQSHFAWLREWALPRRESLNVRFEGLEVSFADGPVFNGINARLEGSAISLEVPLRHVAIGGADVSSMLKLEGAFDAGTAGEK